MPFGRTMKVVVTAWFVAGVFLRLVPRVQAQATGAAASNPAQSNIQAPIPRDPATVQVPLVNYYALGGSAKTELEGTALMSNAKGLAQVAIAKDGSVSVKAQISGLGGPARVGNEVLTYIVGTITPKGLPLKIGELSLNGDTGQLVASTVLRTFGLLVTAEPYSAVTRPSSIVVLTGKGMGETQPPFAL
jgi:hypothetical protein